VLALAIALLSWSPVSAPAAGSGVPGGFFGVVVNNAPLLTSPSFYAQETGVMRSSGVETVRIPVYWAQMQPDQDKPIQFAALDKLVAASAKQRISVLPTVLSSPAWAALHAGDATASPPKNPADYAAFMTQLVKRYGPGGAFWKANARLPQVPIRIWQIWNEPNLKLFWNIKPYAPPYVALLKASYAAIKKADPGAKVMMAGLPNRSWDALSAIYKAGAKPFFDIAAVHPYTHSPPDVMHIVAINRRVMNRNGDQRKTISLTETGWCTDNYETVNQITWNTHDGQQATNLTRLFTALVKERKSLNVQSVYWFNWYAPQDHYVHGWEDFCGLRERRGGKTVSKPVLAAYSKIAHQNEH
jgi:hypothetical protein